LRQSLVSYHLALPLLLCLSGCATQTLAPRAIIDGRPAPVPAIRMGDPATITRIIDEGKNRSRVMDHLRHLSQEIGPRLTGSSNADKANLWAAEQFTAWGLAGVEQFKWGDVPVRFDRGPSTGKIVIREEKKGEGDEVKVEYKPVRNLEFTTLAWAGGTTGAVRGPVVRIPETDDEFVAVQDQLRGAWVLLKPATVTGRQGIRAVGGSMNDRALVRYSIQTGKSLADLGVNEKDLPTLEGMIPEQQRLIGAGVLGFISAARDERVWTTAFRRWRDLTPGAEPRDVEVSVRLSDYDYMNSRLADGEKFEAEFDLNNVFTPGPLPMYNTVAEIRGTERPDECIIVSAHLDSWNGPGSEGTTDNGTGSSVTLEAARLLMAAGAKPKRTIKFILWTGEEQGLLGSREWVKQNEALWPKISACFVDDGGTNYEGGLKCTDAMAPMLAAATAPVNNHFFDSKDGKPLNVNIQPRGDAFEQSGGSDHASFIAKGIPGFFWDEVGRADYGRGWHTQYDRMDLAVPEYLMQSATCAAVTAYNLACAEELLPRWEENEGSDSGGEGRRR